jgi:hypothetical protein
VGGEDEDVQAGLRCGHGWVSVSKVTQVRRSTQGRRIVMGVLVGRRGLMGGK